MRLAVLAPSRFALRQPYAGGQEALVATLVTALRRRGHHVTLYAPPGTDRSLADTLVPFPELPSLSGVGALDPGLPEPRFLADHHAFAGALADLADRTRDGRVEAVLNHGLHQLPLMLGGLLRVPMLTTLHTPPVAWMELGAALAPAGSRYVAVSRAIASQWTTLTTPPAVIHNGIETADFPVGPGGPDLAWLGRITPEKGTHLAIHAARLAGRRLTVAGPVYDPEYFESTVRPLLGDDVTYVGHLDHAGAAALLGSASALLVTPRWDEPFGLVAAEAAVCGTPVVALARGGLTEVVSPGLGALVADASDEVAARRLADAVPAVERLDRAAVAAEARDRHGADRMAREYERLLRRLLTDAGAPRRRVTASTASSPVRVQHIPAGHAYTRRIAPAGVGSGHDGDPGETGIVTLPDPPVPGAPEGQWWPHPGLEPEWVFEHAAEVDVVHLHFGFEHRTPGQLAEWAESLRRTGTGLVLTVHDLDNPHLAPGPEGAAGRREYAAGLDVLMRAADEITTLTAGAAAEVRRRSGRAATVHPHPHVVSPAWLDRPRPAHDGFVVTAHAKSLRPSVDVDVLVGELMTGTAALPSSVLRLHVHADVLERTHARFDARVAELVTNPPEHVDVRVHGPLSDEELWRDLLGSDLAVLPYRTGTHSGWLQMCHDLGTAVLAPDVGHLTEQRPVWGWTRGRPGDLTRALETAHAAHLAGMRAVRPDARAALAEAEEVRGLHVEMHRRIAERYRARRLRPTDRLPAPGVAAERPSAPAARAQSVSTPGVVA